MSTASTVRRRIPGLPGGGKPSGSITIKMSKQRTASARNTNITERFPPTDDMAKGAEIAPKLKKKPSRFRAAARPPALTSATSALAAVFRSPPPTP